MHLQVKYLFANGFRIFRALCLDHQIKLASMSLRSLIYINRLKLGLPTSPGKIIMSNLTTSITVAIPHSEFAVDTAAVSAINFCGLWASARPALVALQAIVSSSLVKFAITTVLAAGDAYCGAPKTTSKADVLQRLQNAGIGSLDDLAGQIVNKVSDPIVADGAIVGSQIVWKK